VPRRSTDAPTETSAASTLRTHLGIYGSGRLIALAANAGIVLLLSRAGGGLYYQYSLVVLAVTSGSNLGFGWLRQAILRDSSQASSAVPGSGGPPAASVRVLAVAATASALASLTLARLFLGPQPLVLWAATFAYGLAYCFYLNRLTLAQSSLSPVGAIISDTVRLALPVIVIALVMALGEISLTAAVSLTALGAAAAGVSRSADQVGHTRSWAADLRFGFPVAVWLTLSSVIQVMDRFIVEQRVGAEAANDYAASYDLIFRGVAALAFPMIAALHPLVMEAANRSAHGDVRKLVLAGMKYLVGALVLAEVAAFLVSRYGARFDSGLANFAVLANLAIAGVAWQAALIVHKPYELARRTGLMVAVLLTTLLASMVANWFLAPSHGILGVSITAWLAPCAYCAGLLALWPRVRAAAR